VDLSGFIFVALAIAWAVYLIPKALRHHDEVARSRSVDRFSATMRVLARREPVSSRDARLVVTPGRAASAAVVTTKRNQPSAAQIRARREAIRRATARRRRVLGLILVANAVVAGLAAAAVIGWVWQAVPAGLLVAWLVACRVMVRSEHASWDVVSPQSSSSVPAAEAEEPPDDYSVARNDQGFAEVDSDADTSTLPAVVDPDLWDPLPVTLPTYVTKPAAARRTVRTIDLGEPGAWTSGHTEEASAVARESDAVAAAAREAEVAEERRATGS
jgi:hypothetical protein